MLVASSFLPYSSEVRDIVLSTCPHLEGQYLVERWDLAKAEIDIGSLQLDSMLTLSKSKALPLTQKIQMWSGLSLETIESKPDAVPELGRVSMLANQSGERFADSLTPVLRHLVRNASLTPEQRSEMLTQCLAGMKWPDVAAALGLLDDEDFKTVSAKVNGSRPSTKPKPCRSPVAGYATPNSFSSCACSQVLSSSTGSVLYDCSESKM
ncbi:hypothetical protein [Pseudomonas syringae]|uniref:hypothetical protein n=1 Tax=Pseudomonas syringae TaxID=317 RepID=UPI000A9A7A1C|nr:hypothetical protein [Pseudomonas syringae]